MKLKYSILAASLLGMAATLPAGAAISLIAEYHLGETGSLSGTNNLPQDSSGNSRHYTGNVSGSSATVGTTGVVAPGSTAYLDTGATNVGWFGANMATIPTNNFAVGIYARASALPGSNTDILTLGDADGTYSIGTGGNGWGASARNVSWIGNAGGTTGSFTADTWVHLALIRDNGTTTFYIDGVAQGSGYGVAPVVGTSSHMAVTPGGTAYFDGHIDEARVVSFTTGVDSTQDVLDSLTAVPEPSSTALLGLGGFALILRRRK